MIHVGLIATKFNFYQSEYSIIDHIKIIGVNAFRYQRSALIVLNLFGTVDFLQNQIGIGLRAHSLKLRHSRGFWPASVLWLAGCSRRKAQQLFRLYVIAGGFSQFQLNQPDYTVIYYCY